MSTICFYAQFTASKVGVNSLTVTWDIEQITRSDGTRSALVTGGANGITIGRRGLYGYVLANADLTLYDYVATAITADTSVDQKEVAAVWTEWILPSVPQTGDSYAVVNTRLPAALTANGNIKASLVEILTTALTETTGQISAAFKKFFNVAAPTGTVNSLPDAVPGTANGLALKSDVSSGVTAYVAVSEAVAAGVSTGSLVIETYHTMAQSVTSTVTDDLNAAKKLWLSVKDPKDGDTESLIFLEKTAGLTVVNKATYATTTDGALTVFGSSEDWTIAIDIAGTPLGLLHSLGDVSKRAEVKALIGTKTVNVWSGPCEITRGVVRTMA